MQKNDISKIHLHLGFLRASPTLSYLSSVMTLLAHAAFFILMMIVCALHWLHSHKTTFGKTI